MVHWAISNFSCNKRFSASLCRMILCKSDVGERASRSMISTGMSMALSSSVKGYLPSRTADEESEAPSTWCGGNTRCSEDEDETPSTGCGESTRRAAANKVLWPLWYVTRGEEAICLGMLISGWCDGPPSSWTASGPECGCVKKSREMKSAQGIPCWLSWWETTSWIRPWWHRLQSYCAGVCLRKIVAILWVSWNKYAEMFIILTLVKCIIMRIWQENTRANLPSHVK